MSSHAIDVAKSTARRTFTLPRATPKRLSQRLVRVGKDGIGHRATQVEYDKPRLYRYVNDHPGSGFGACPARRLSHVCVSLRGIISWSSFLVMRQVKLGIEAGIHVFGLL